MTVIKNLGRHRRVGGERPGQLPDAREAGGDSELDTRALGRGGGGVGSATRSTASGMTAAMAR
jgi:hypothetical protein